MLVFISLKYFHLCDTRDIASNLMIFLSNYFYNKTQDLEISKTLLSECMISTRSTRGRLNSVVFRPSDLD